jgi:anthranilate phosphoribosyltransferase
MDRAITETRELLQRLIDRRDLDGCELERFLGEVMDGRCDPVEVAAVLVALRAKGETPNEVAAAARAMRARALTVPVADPERAVDTCGTGGDGSETLNISTAAALVAAAAGVPIAKHGNRSVSSRCGSADVLEAAGMRLELGPEALARLHDEIGIAFLFAPRLHPAMASVMPVRRILRVRTVFNLLGPLTNPAGVRRQVVGVWGREVQPLVAGALAKLGARHALVVHSDDGLDELSVAAPTTVLEVRDGAVVGSGRVDPLELGLEAGDPESMLGGSVAENAARLQLILDGRERSAAAEAVALNAAAALYVGGIVADLAEGVVMARKMLRSGAAGEKLRRLVQRSQELADGG